MPTLGPRDRERDDAAEIERLEQLLVIARSGLRDAKGTLSSLFPVESPPVQRLILALRRSDPDVTPGDET
jgi:hypothetical protein